MISHRFYLLVYLVYWVFTAVQCSLFASVSNWTTDWTTGWTTDWTANWTTEWTTDWTANWTTVWTTDWTTVWTTDRATTKWPARSGSQGLDHQAQFTPMVS